MALVDRETGTKEDGTLERSKIMVGRAPGDKPWWRITVYVGDTSEEIDTALQEALRVDRLLSEGMS